MEDGVEEEEVSYLQKAKLPTHEPPSDALK